MTKKQLAKEPTKAMMKRGMAYGIIEHAINHNLTITPVGYKYYVEDYLQYRCCPCDPNRAKCPCEESVLEVKEKGSCKCQLFWRDLATFKEAKFKGGK